MSYNIHLKGPRDSQTGSSKPLDETVWRAWLSKNLLEERERAVARIKAVKWACLGVLTTTAVVSSYVFSPYAFSPAGNWVILLAAVLPFVAALAWMKERTRRAAVPTSAVR